MCCAYFPPPLLLAVPVSSTVAVAVEGFLCIFCIFVLFFRLLWPMCWTCSAPHAHTSPANDTSPHPPPPRRHRRHPLLCPVPLLLTPFVSPRLDLDTPPPAILSSVAVSQPHTRSRCVWGVIRCDERKNPVYVLVVVLDVVVDALIRFVLY